MVALSTATAAAEDLPPWLSQALAAPAPAPKVSVSAIVLLDEAQVVVEEGGKVTTTRRRAVRVLTREGRVEARGDVVYQSDTGKVRSMRGWLRWPTGGVRKYGKDKVVDRELSPNALYSDVRLQTLAAVDEAGPGLVFAYESVLEDRSVFTQFDWSFQDELPVLVSRFTVVLPPGWRAEGVVFNHDGVPPVQAGPATTWELRALVPVERELSGPAVSSIAPWLAVNVLPAPGARTGLGRVFDGWADVARWLSELADPQMVASEGLREKAQALAGGARSERERIEAIARYVQGVRYVSIQTGLGRGGGYKPHSAAEVFAMGYGDCKDKANLMRTMLKVVGIEAYPVAIYAGDRTRVRASWPSPQQFNHAIVAARIRDEASSTAAAAREYEGLGGLLFFDPTDEHTPFGLLPQEEEGSQALLIARDRGALLRMPSSPPDANRVERRLEAELSVDGTLSGRVEERALGHAAAAYRRQRERGGASGFTRRYESWFSRGGTGAKVTSLEAKDQDGGGLRVDLSFETPRYAPSMRGNLLVVKPNVLPQPGSVYLREPTRRHPVVLDSESFEETTRIRLPEGFVVDELPRSSRSTTDFGSYSQACRVESGYLACRRSLSVSAGVIPVEGYGEAFLFFSGANSAGGEPVVLVRTPGARSGTSSRR
jgi:hypothetical protein